MSENIANTQRVAWNTVECLLQKILSGGSLSEEECVELSKSVRRYCGKRKIKALTLPRSMRLYARLRCFLEKHIESLKHVSFTFLPIIFSIYFLVINYITLEDVVLMQAPLSQNQK